MKYPNLKHLYYIGIFIFAIIVIICIIYITIIKKAVNKINLEIDTLDYITSNNDKKFNDYVVKIDTSIQTFNTHLQNNDIHLQNNDIAIQTINTRLQNTDSSIANIDTKINSYIDKINTPIPTVTLNPIIPPSSSSDKDKSIVELHNKLLTCITSNDSKLNEYIVSNDLKLNEYIATNDDTNKLFMDHLDIVTQIVNKFDSMNLQSMTASRELK